MSIPSGVVRCHTARPCATDAAWRTERSSFPTWRVAEPGQTTPQDLERGGQRATSGEGGGDGGQLPLWDLCQREDIQQALSRHTPFVDHHAPRPIHHQIVGHHSADSTSPLVKHSVKHTHTNPRSSTSLTPLLHLPCNHPPHSLHLFREDGGGGGGWRRREDEGEDGGGWRMRERVEGEGG